MRLELDTAIEHGVEILPIALERARMLAAAAFDATLAQLAEYQALKTTGPKAGSTIRTRWSNPLQCSPGHLCACASREGIETQMGRQARDPNPCGRMNRSCRTRKSGRCSP